MASSLPVLPEAGPAASELLNSEKVIWIVVIALSIFVPCLVACVIYAVRRRRQRKDAPDIRDDLAFDPSLDQWLENVRCCNQSESSLVTLTATNAPPPIYSHYATHRSVSTPNFPVSYGIPQRSKSPLQGQRQSQFEWTSDKNIIQFPPPRPIYPATKNYLAQ